MKHPDLSNKQGTLAFTLRENSQIINERISSSEPLQTTKDFITTIINGITEKEIKSPATQRFLTALQRTKSKMDLQFLVYNTILAGDNLQVK